MTNSNRRGNLVARDGQCTLEHVGGRSYVGTARSGAGTASKRFRRGDEDESAVVERWRRWKENKAKDTEDQMEKSVEKSVDKEPRVAECPFTGAECAPQCRMWSAAHGSCAVALGCIALHDMSAGIGKLDVREPIELLAMAVAESGNGAHVAAEAGEHTEADGVEAYMQGKTFLAFVNLHSKTAYAPYRRFCEQEGYPHQKESEFTKTVLERFGELHSEKAHGGVRFAA